MALKLEVLLQMLDKASAPLRKVQGASKDAGAELRKTRNALRELEKQQADLAGFRNLKRQLQDSKTQMTALRQQQRQLTAAMAKGGEGADKDAAALKRVTKAADKLKATRRSQLEQLRQLSDRLADSGVRTRTLGSAEERVRSDIGRATAAIDKQTAALRRQGEQARKVEALQTRLHRGQAMAAGISIAGYASYEGGRRVLEELRPMLDQAKQYQTNIAQLRAQGSSAADVAAAERFANTDRTQGSSINDKLEIVKDANSIFRDMHEALAVAPQLLKAKFTFEGLMSANGEGAGHGGEIVNQLIDAVRTGELRNATKTPEQFNHMLDMMSRAYVGSGGLVKPSDYLQAMKVGGVAAKQMDEKALFFGAMHTIQEMGGMRAGTGFASAYQNWAAGRSTQQTAEALAQLGLVNKDAVKYGKNGHITKLLPGALVNQGLYESNPFEYLMKEVIPRINPAGKLSDNEVVSKLNALFSARKGGDLFAGMFMQRANIEKQMKAADRFGSLQSSYDATGRTAQGMELILAKQSADLHQEIGTQLLPLYVAGMRKLLGVLRGLTAWARNHPVLTKGIAAIGATFGVLMVAAGGLMVALGGLVGQFALLRFAVGRVGLGLAGRSAAVAGAEASTGTAARSGLLARLGGRAGRFFPALASGARAAMAAVVGVSAPVAALIALLSVGALLVYKYWQPIRAFFVGVGRGIAQVTGPALRDLGTALAPLKPAWDALCSALGTAWRWLGALLTPMQATQAQLAGATANGVTFGRALGYVVSGVATAVKWFVELGTAMGRAVGWVVTHWGAIGDAIKAPFVRAFGWVSDKIDYLIRKWKELRSHLPGGGDSTDAGSPRNWEWNDGSAPPPRFANTPPLRPGAGGTTVSNSYQVSVTAAPGHEQAAALAVSDELDRRERAKAAARRSALADHD